MVQNGNIVPISVVYARGKWGGNFRYVGSKGKRELHRLTPVRDFQSYEVVEFVVPTIVQQKSSLFQCCKSENFWKMLVPHPWNALNPPLQDPVPRLFFVKMCSPQRYIEAITLPQRGKSEKRMLRETATVEVTQAIVKLVRAIRGAVLTNESSLVQRQTGRTRMADIWQAFVDLQIYFTIFSWKSEIIQINTKANQESSKIILI